MRTLLLILAIAYSASFQNIFGRPAFESDTIHTGKGDLIVNFVGHGSLYFVYNGLVVHIDPVGQYADYSNFPKADIILVTHHHGDHFDKETIKLISKPETNIILTQACSESFENTGKQLKNGESINVMNLKIDAVAAYNIEHKRDSGEPFHPKGNGNGYVITFGDVKVYIGGDTENVPEMAELKNIDVAFLPMNLPYTMTPKMVAKAVEMFKPKVLYPYHFGETDTNELLELLKNITYCEVRLRRMQ